MAHDVRVDPRPPDGESNRSVGFLGSLVPRSVVRRALTVRLQAPDTFVIGGRNRFRLHVRNRLPFGVALTLPTSRSWGWEVAGVPEAGAGRYDPPAVSMDLAFGPRERRTFTGHWDGHVKRTTGDRERWEPLSGTQRLVSYVAVDEWRKRGCYDTATVRVVGPE